MKTNIPTILKAFQFKSNVEEKENVFIPKVQSTVQVEKVSYNEMQLHIHEQLRIRYAQKT